jgi:hypothetical protein
MLVSGSIGRKSPYAIKIITQMNLCLSVLAKNTVIADIQSSRLFFPYSNISIQSSRLNYVIPTSVVINSSFFLFSLKDVATN